MLKMVRKDVTADDSESLGFKDRILAIEFRIAKDLPQQNINRAWVVKYLKRTKKKLVQLNWNRSSYECAMDSPSEEPALSLESNCKLSLSSAVIPPCYF